MALGYVIGLARQTFAADKGVRKGEWPKPACMSLSGKNAAVVGLGDIGLNTAKWLKACGMQVTAYDPAFNEEPTNEHVYQHRTGPNNLEIANPIVRVARAPLIDEAALIRAQQDQIVQAYALRAFANEPLPNDSLVLMDETNIGGSHNSSNTKEGVIWTSRLAITRLDELLV